MARFVQHIGDAEGWSEWINPTQAVYKLACCDCALVHDMEFRVVRFASETSEEYEEVEGRIYGVIFRAKRNNRSTGQMRRARHSGNGRGNDAETVKVERT